MTDAESLSGLASVSRETRGRLETYAALLEKWQKSINLVSPKTLPELWTRHFADSAQLLAHAPEKPGIWADLGSGGGFPGLVVAILLMERDPDSRVFLIESDTRKAAFLQAVIAETRAPATVIAKRAEQAAEVLPEVPRVISARALAPLVKLCELAWPYWSPGCVGLFLKGRDVGSELTEAAKCWNISARQLPSHTAADGVILKLEELARVRS